MASLPNSPAKKAKGKTPLRAAVQALVSQCRQLESDALSIPTYAFCVIFGISAVAAWRTLTHRPRDRVVVIVRIHHVKEM